MRLFWLCITVDFDWLRYFAQLLNKEAKINRVLPRLAPATCISFDVSRDISGGRLPPEIPLLSQAKS